MFDKKYRIVEIKSHKGVSDNPIHTYALNAICYPAYFKVGERGWMLCEVDDFFNPIRRIHTSIIQNIEKTQKGFLICTENTVYVIEEVDTDGMECILA